MLAAIVMVESAFIGATYFRTSGAVPPRYVVGAPQVNSFQFSVFNQPISNDTDNEFTASYNGSWVVTIRSWLTASPNSKASESEVALAPSYPLEAKSIPTIIVQERADGLLRIEYFAQAWANTYGLVLYNATNASWRDGGNVTLTYHSFGTQSPINPSIAPRANGNLSVSAGGAVIVSDYPIAWASLGAAYLYGIPGSSFTGGNVMLVVQSLTRD